MSENLNVGSTLEKEGLLGDVRTNLSGVELLPSYSPNNDPAPDTSKPEASFFDGVLLGFASTTFITILISTLCAVYSAVYILLGFIIISALFTFTVDTASLLVYAEIGAIGGAATGAGLATNACWILAIFYMVRREKTKSDLDGFRMRHNSNGSGRINLFFQILSAMLLCFVVGPFGVVLLKRYRTAFGANGGAADLEVDAWQAVEAALVGKVVVFCAHWLRARCIMKRTSGKVKEERTTTGEASNDPVAAKPLVSVSVEQV